MTTIFRRIHRIVPLLLLLGCVAAGCEDDPILTPGSGDQQKGGGSYGRIDRIGQDDPASASSVSVMANPDDNRELF